MNDEPVCSPMIVNLRHHALQPDWVYVGRLTVWGNPFREGRDGTRDEVVEKFRAWFRGRPNLVRRARRELRGKILACWCAPERCHAEVLREIANSKEERS